MDSGRPREKTGVVVHTTSGVRTAALLSHRRARSGLRAALQSFRSVVAAGAPATTALPYLRLLPDKNRLPPELSPISWEQPAMPSDDRGARRVGDSHTRAVTEAFVAARVGEMTRIQGVGNTEAARGGHISCADVPMVESVLVESGDATPVSLLKKSQKYSKIQRLQGIPGTSQV
ncbi:hypothetical protein GGX14DRAFT_401974 [Mycena pura]|uniref:Uncharacterized protein n=1 Tax=Mycena pura TaxID=153505 RepID=A0AAD6UYU4_9AGAR|nr:hypothetical protein GGX14DRAFT_401974 [Mycena pura]